MRHVKIAELVPGAVGMFEPEGPTSLDNLSRELALAAAHGDERLRLLNAMKMLGNVRDLLVGPLSSEAERLLGQAIHELMRREREIPAEWRTA